MKTLYFFSLSIFLIILSACASFEKNEVPRVESLPDVSQYQNKPRVYFDVDYYIADPNKAENAVPLSARQEPLEKLVIASIGESGLFEDFTFDETRKKEMDYTIRLQIYNHGNAGAAAVSGFISGFTFGVVPGAATDNFTLKVGIKENNGKVLEPIQNKDSVTTWIGIWFIPMSGNTPMKAIDNTLLNQIRSALKEAVESQRLQYSSFNQKKYI